MKKTINNVLMINKLIRFEEDKSKYVFITIYQRKKDNPEIKEQMTAIKHYYVDSYKALECALPEIITLCDTFNARAYITYGLRDKSKIISSILSKLAAASELDSISNININKLALLSQDAMRKIKPRRDDSYYLVDCDFTDIDDNQAIDNMLKEAGAEKIFKIYTPNGYHHLATKLDTFKFEKLLASSEIQNKDAVELKGYDAYTLLYSCIDTDKLKVKQSTNG